MEKNLCKKIFEACQWGIVDFDERLSTALSIMDRLRCPLYKADYLLYDDMSQFIAEWCCDEGVDPKDVPYADDVIMSR